MSDVDDIRDLTYTYAFLVDTRQVDEMVDTVFTEDGVFDATPVGQELMEGAEGIRAFFHEQNKTLMQSVHVTTNHRISVDGDLAHGTVYYLVRGVTSDGSEVSAHGYYDDQYRRTSDGWKISVRKGIPLLPPKLSAVGATPVDVA